MSFILNPYRFALAGGAPFVDFSDEAFYQASDLAASDEFGYAVAMSGDGLTLAVGAPDDDNSIGTDAGSVYIFVCGSGNSWTEQARLQPTSGGVADGHFGYSLSISDDGNTLVVGAPATTGILGKAFVFTRSGTTWSQHTDLYSIASATPGAGERFGNGVAINAAGDTIAVGCPLRGAFDLGAIWCFALSGGAWDEQASNLPATGAASTDYVGARLALSDDGNVLVASTRNKNALDVFTRSGSAWSHSMRLSIASFTGVSPSSFTTGVAISGDGKRAYLCLVGETVGGTSQAGGVYEFTESGGTWTEGHHFTRATQNIGQEYGRWITVNNSGDRAVIAHSGAFKDVEVWERVGSTWTREQTLGVTLGDGDFFAPASLDNTGLILAVGAYGDDTGAAGAGAVYTFM